MKKLILAFLPLLLLTGCFSQEKKELHGYVEGEFVMVAPTSGGILESLSVQQGESVKTGEPLFSLDLTDLRAQKAGAEAKITKLKTEIDNAQKEYNRVLHLSKTGVSSTANLDDATTTLSTLNSMLESAKQALIQIENKLREATPVAPGNGIIQETFYEAGEYIHPGQPVVSLLPRENIKVRFFVSQETVASLTLGQPLSIGCDGCSTPITAKISYIAPNAEYTPPVIYSVESRDKLVFMIEATPDDYNASLRPGLPVSIDLVR